MSKTVVISDIHIGDDSDTCWYRTEVHEPYLLALLEWVIQNRDDIRELIILGDLVDFWTYPPNRVPPTMKEIVDKNPNTLGPHGKLSRVLTALNGNVTYLPGNHDMGMSLKDLKQIRNPHHEIKKAGNVLIRDNVLYTHGHLDTLFNAPDNREGRRFKPLPVGHFVTRALSLKLLKNKKENRAAYLPAQGSLIEEEAWLPWMMSKLGGLNDALHSLGSLRKKGVVAALLKYMSRFAKIGLHQVFVKLSKTETVAWDSVLNIYEHLFSEWWEELAREVNSQEALLMTLKSVEADYDGSYLGWFAQRRAMQNLKALKWPYLVVMGHTHAPRVGLHQASTSYLNTGYLCPSIPDMKKGHQFTFGVINHRYNPIQGDYAEYDLYQVVKDSYKIEKTTADPARIAYPYVVPRTNTEVGGDSSCYILIENKSKYAIKRFSMEAKEGYYVVPPPASIDPGESVHFWLQDYPGSAGSDGTVTYKQDTDGRIFTLSYRCPYLGIYHTENFASGGDELTTKSGGQTKFSKDIATKGFPFFVNYTVNDWDGWTEWYGNPGADHTFIVSIPDDTYLVGVQIRDQSSYGIVNMRFLGTKDIFTESDDISLMPEVASGFENWVSWNRNVTTIFPSKDNYYRCEVGAYINGFILADVPGHGIVNVSCHCSDGSNSGWLTNNEPVNGSYPKGIYPPRIQDEAVKDWIGHEELKRHIIEGNIWDHAVKGHIRRIEIHRQDDYGLIDFRYGV